MDYPGLSIGATAIVPLGGMALLELDVIGKGLDQVGKLKLHAIFVAIFLVVAHVAMIFEMLNPTLLKAEGTGSPPGWSDPARRRFVHVRSARRENGELDQILTRITG